jgi:hypothetical protein
VLAVGKELQSSSTFERDWRGPYFDTLSALGKCCSPTPGFWSKKDIKKLEMVLMTEMVLERK